MEDNQLEAARRIYETAEFRDLMDFLNKETIEETMVRHYRHCGGHSNIPSCCVEFFIKYWRGKMHKSLTGCIYRLLKRLFYPADRIPAYVPCPKCLTTGHSQPLYECDWLSESVDYGECRPTGRVIGFDNDPPLPDAPQMTRTCE